MNSKIRQFTRVAAFLAAVPCSHAADLAAPRGTVVDLSADASQSAANDLAMATVFAEATDASAAEVAKKVNAAIAAALQSAKAYPSIKARTASTNTYPNYGKNGLRIETWRMRSEVILETRDMTALSELLGKLQSNLGIGSVALSPAPETRAKAEERATLDAIAAFKARAKLVADALGSPFRIRQMSVQGGHRPPPMPMMRSAMMAESAAPIEAGESSVSVSVSGQIELLEAGR